MAYLVRGQISGLFQNVHGWFQEWHESGANCKCNITKAAQNGDLDLSVQRLTLKRIEEGSHKALRVRLSMFAEGTADVANYADSDRTELGILRGLNGIE